MKRLGAAEKELAQDLGRDLGRSRASASAAASGDRLARPESLGESISQLGSRRRQERRDTEQSEVASTVTNDDVASLWEVVQEDRRRRSERRDLALGLGSQSSSSGGTEIPRCPECQSWMIVKSNATNGRKFWACPGYPRCEGTRQIPRDLQPQRRATVLQDPQDDGSSTEEKLRKALYQRQVQQGIFKPGIRVQ
jgi:hypothetical protein